MRLRRLLVLLIIPLVALVAFLEQPPATVTSATVPANFTDTSLFNVSGPTALAFTPDNRLLITTQSGILRIYQNGALLATPAMTIPASKICANGERGLLGVAVDPEFATNHYIYIFYTFQKNGNCNTNSATGPVSRVSRFVLGNDNLVVVNWNTTPVTGETVLLDNIPSFAGNHNGGDLHFGQDRLLYISVGDSGCSFTTPTNCQGANDNARSLKTLAGKILRINKDGSIPKTNPRYNEANSRRCSNAVADPNGVGSCQEMFSWGLRNPFRFTLQPGTNQFYINDVGEGTWEEIDVSQANADFGWSTREGHCANGSTSNCGAPPAGMTNPIFDYQHGAPDNCNSITGGAFAPAGVWPAPYDGNYFFADFVCGKIFRLTGTPGSYTKTDFVTGMGGSSAVALVFGPYQSTQAMYYTTYAGGGSVHVLSYDNPPACNPNLVTNPNLDDVNTCGTLRYAVANAQAGSAINLGAGPISLTSTLTISKVITLQGKSNCSVGTAVTIQATGNAATNNTVDGLVLSGGVHLVGVTIKDFGRKQLVLTGGPGVVSNVIECTKTTSLP